MSFVVPGTWPSVLSTVACSVGSQHCPWAVKKHHVQMRPGGIMGNSFLKIPAILSATPLAHLLF